jgi:hypothetical protein
MANSWIPYYVIVITFVVKLISQAFGRMKSCIAIELRDGTILPRNVLTKI